MKFNQQAFAMALLDPASQIAASPIWKHHDASARFAIYRNNVAASLINALADTFPVCRELVGEEFFQMMALEFVRAHPPKTRILAYYGDVFPDFVRGFAPAATAPYLADIARLEYHRVFAYHAADDVSSAGEAITNALSNADRTAVLRFKLHASVKVVPSQFAVFSLWAAHQDAFGIESVDPDMAETAFIFRRGLDVQTMLISSAAGTLIDELKSGAYLIDALQIAEQSDPAFVVTEVMAILLKEQLITGIGDENLTEPFNPSIHSQ